MKLLGIGSRIQHSGFGFGVVTNVDSKNYWVTFQESGMETIPLNSEFEVIEAITDELDTISFYEVENTLRNLLKKYSDISEVIHIADKWKGGTLTLAPKDSNLSSKEIPIDGFFHKIVMVRDRVRVMEQKINASKTLDDQDKIDLQQYITRIYGSLTTFNVLFKLKSDHFVGSKSK
jgi:hypothetical protein